MMSQVIISPLTKANMDSWIDSKKNSTSGTKRTGEGYVRRQVKRLRTVVLLAVGRTAQSGTGGVRVQHHGQLQKPLWAADLTRMQVREHLGQGHRIRVSGSAHSQFGYLRSFGDAQSEAVCPDQVLYAEGRCFPRGWIFP